MVFYNCKKKKIGYYRKSFLEIPPLFSSCTVKSSMLHKNMCVGAGSRSELPPLAPECSLYCECKHPVLTGQLSRLWLPAWSLSVVLLSVLWLTAASSYFADP